MNFWWSHTDSICYVGASSKDGIQFARHEGYAGYRGYWRVAVTGWGMECRAVMDVFGNLVRVWK
jgi:hypothetical protein